MEAAVVVDTTGGIGLTGGMTNPANGTMGAGNSRGLVRMQFTSLNAPASCRWLCDMRPIREFEIEELHHV
jgi:hypothetical protein